MLHEFLVEHREAIVDRARVKVGSRRVPLATPQEITSGVPLFLAQLTALLREEQRRGAPVVPTSDARARAMLEDTAEKLGGDMRLAGLTVAQVVEGYGDVCQAITEQAIHLGLSITGDEYRTLNLCLDIATASAVTVFSAERERSIRRTGTERLGELAHELRNLLNTATLSYEALRRGAVGIESRTGGALGRSLQGLRELVDRSLAEVRLAAALHLPERVVLAELLEEIEVAAGLAAKERGLELAVAPVDRALAVDADRQLLASAVANVVQNAIKFTRRGGRVSITVREESRQAVIEVADQCGGLPEGKSEALFQPFESHGRDRSGLGLGLTISREAVRANRGEIGVRNVPGDGCVFRISLPVAP